LSSKKLGGRVPQIEIKGNPKAKRIPTVIAGLLVTSLLGGCSEAPVSQPESALEPSPALAMAYENPSEPGAALSTCKIREVSGARQNVWAGFPRLTPATENMGTVKWALIPIDFKDLPGEADVRSRIEEQTSLLSEWFETVSEGKFTVDWVILDSWVRIPGNSKDYELSMSENLGSSENGPKLFRAAMDSADPVFDFTDIQTVNFILPAGQSFLGESSQGFPWDDVVRNYKSAEGKIDSYSIAGKFFDAPGRTYWSYWAHEFGHSMGLPHIGASRGETPPFNPWDLMGGQDGPSRELSGWLRFLTGWLENDQVFCKDTSQTQDLTLTLVPLSDDLSGIKLGVIPLSKSRAILLESRRETKFSCATSPARNGVLIYIYDATIGHNENFFTEVSPPGREIQYSECEFSPQTPDLLLRAGDSVSVEGYTIKVIEHAEYDRVLISRD
jgi:M6 family metalloprotease-like protein